MKILKSTSWFTAGVLLFFTARRWLFLFAALAPDRHKPAAPLGIDLPSVTVLAPVRNELDELPAFLAALDRLDYPAESLTVLLLDDGSTDGSGALMSAWATKRVNWQLVSLPRTVGKARALNVGLRHETQSKIIAVYDADERPRPDALRYLVTSFGDERVGAVSGRRAVSNVLDSPAASYATLEGLVHQLVTMRAKDRLDLGPAVLGANCAYRRRALAAVGAFRPGALLEDSDLSLRLPQAGWKVRFEAAAISYHAVPRTLGGYWRQHRRWARGFNEVARERGSSLLFDPTLPLSLRLELVTFALGYLDRVALAAAGGLIILKRWTRFPVWVVILSLLTPFLQTIVALKLAAAPRAMWKRIIWLPLFFGFDLAMVASALWTTLRQTPPTWEERRNRK